MTLGPVAWVPRFVILWLDILIMSGILWLYQTQGLFMIYAPETDMIKNSYDGYTWTAGYKKREVYVTLSFDLVKVHWPATLFHFPN